MASEQEARKFRIGQRVQVREHARRNVPAPVGADVSRGIVRELGTIAADLSPALRVAFALEGGREVLAWLRPDEIEALP